MKPDHIGFLKDGTEIVEVKCPTCNSDRLEPEGIGYECVRCGQWFRTDYEEIEKE